MRPGRGSGRRRLPELDRPDEADTDTDTATNTDTDTDTDTDADCATVVFDSTPFDFMLPTAPVGDSAPCAQTSASDYGYTCADGSLFRTASWS